MRSVWIGRIVRVVRGIWISRIGRITWSTSSSSSSRSSSTASSIIASLVSSVCWGNDLEWKRRRYTVGWHCRLTDLVGESV